MNEVSTENAKTLFKDLCARCPYGVRGQVYLKVPRIVDWHLVDQEIVIEVKLLGIREESLIITAVDENGDIVDELDNNRILVEDTYEITCFNFKPYLRSMDDMTEEEKKEYRKVCELDTEILAKHPMNGEPFPALYNSIDWLNKKMFDYKGLIEKGLAIEAPKGMYN